MTMIRDFGGLDRLPSAVETETGTLLLLVDDVVDRSSTWMTIRDSGGLDSKAG